MTCRPQVSQFDHLDDAVLIDKLIDVPLV